MSLIEYPRKKFVHIADTVRQITGVVGIIIIALGLALSIHFHPDQFQILTHSILAILYLIGSIIYCILMITKAPAHLIYYPVSILFVISSITGSTHKLSVDDLETYERIIAVIVWTSPFAIALVDELIIQRWNIRWKKI